MPATLYMTLSGETVPALTRSFNASHALLWRALTDPAILPRWQWAQGWPMVTCAMDVTVGSAFRWVWRTAPDHLVGVQGGFPTVEVPHRLIHAETFDEDWTWGEAIVTRSLIEAAPRPPGWQ